MTMLLTAAAAGSAPSLYSDDVFRTWFHTGTSGNQTITNGIDLAGKGGLVWVKKLNSATTGSHGLVDTVRGAPRFLSANLVDAEFAANSVSGFSSTGFTLGDDSAASQQFNTAGYSYVSWTFRRATKFFDIVTYTGNGVAGRTISHNLGSVPGLIIVKSRSDNGQWGVYHRSLGGNNILYLNTTGASAADSGLWNNTNPTASVFTVGTSSTVNADTRTYVAYLFAHDTAADGLIQCASLVTSASAATWTSVNLGWEPQWILIKNTTTSGNWQLVDVMRRLDGKGTARSLFTNTADAEQSYATSVRINATGFEINSDFLGTSQTLVYVAIRRPNKPPTTGTQVFNVQTYAGNSAARTLTTGFAVDSAIVGSRTASATGFTGLFTSRMASVDSYVVSSSVAGEVTSSVVSSYALNTGVSLDSTPAVNASGTNYVLWALKRAPGFFDVVRYAGTGSAQNIAHNLGVVPEMMIVKKNAIANWPVYAASIGASNSLRLNSTDNLIPDSTIWNSTAPTSTLFTVGTSSDVNTSGTYFAYLFASLPGISKVGSYTGNGGTVNTNGTSQTINCGFTAGARFVLIKRTDASTNWFVFDSARGIVASNDPYVLWNGITDEVTTVDAVDPDNSGFIVNQTSGTNLNVTGASYLYLAIS